MKTAVVEAIGGVDTINDIATEYSGLEIGEDVRAYLPVTKMDDIEGIDTVDVLIAFYPTTPTTSTKLVISSSEVVRVDTSYVSVVVT